VSDIPPPPPASPPAAPEIPPPPPAPGYVPPPVTPGAAAEWFDPNRAYAGFWRRVASRLIDGVVLSFAISVCFLPAFIIVQVGPTKVETCHVDDQGNIDPFSDEADNAFCEVPNGTTWAWTGIAAAAGLVPAVILQVWFYRRLGRTGRSWGRDAMGTRLVDARTGHPVGGGTAFGREIVSSIFSLALGLGFLWMLWDRRKQCWHDKAVGTVVVRVDGR
jgi:uncharacterized RDD family membrane protein YckC